MILGILVTPWKGKCENHGLILLLIDFQFQFKKSIGVGYTDDIF